MALFGAPTAAVEAYPNVRPSKADREDWQRVRFRRVAAYRAACDSLVVAILQHAGDLLAQRTYVIAACSRRSLSPDVVTGLRDGGPALGKALGEAFKRIDWLAACPYLRSHNVGDSPPSEFLPLEAMVEAALSPLRVQHGIPLRPPSESGKALTHQPLASECWPSVVTEQRLVRHAYGDMTWDVPQMVSTQHPVQVAFRAVSEAAGDLDAIDIRQGGKG